MRIFVTGGTGFTGGHLLKALRSHPFQVRCLVRNPAKVALLDKAVEPWEGNLEDRSSLRAGMKGCDVLLNVASLGFGHAEDIVQAAGEAGVSRGVFVSTTSVFTKLNVPSKKVRMAAEELIRGSGMEYTILRPTMIYGSPADRNISRLIRFLDHWPAIPIFGSGQFPLQPVYVADVAVALVQSLLSPSAIRKAYNISGGTSLTYNAMIDTICQELGRKVIKIHLPARPVITLLRWVERFSRRLPVKAEQIERLNEDKSFSHADASRDFGYAPRAFREGIRLELAQLGRPGKRPCA
jgi:uncharacterized protein YbjT (DUF2867 family)